MRVVHGEVMYTVLPGKIYTQIIRQHTVYNFFIERVIEKNFLICNGHSVNFPAIMIACSRDGV